MHVHSTWRSLCTSAASSHILQFRPTRQRSHSFRDTGWDGVSLVLVRSVWRLELLRYTNGGFLGKLPAGDYGGGLGVILVRGWVLRAGKLVGLSCPGRGKHLQGRCRLVAVCDAAVSFQKSHLLTHTNPQLSDSNQFTSKPSLTPSCGRPYQPRYRTI